jgi:hypothetical protein
MAEHIAHIPIINDMVGFMEKLSERNPDNQQIGEAVEVAHLAAILLQRYRQPETRELVKASLKMLDRNTALTLLLMYISCLDKADKFIAGITEAVNEMADETEEMAQAQPREAKKPDADTDSLAT